MNENKQEFAIQSLYIKDVSYEAPHMPKILTSDWQPMLNVNLQTNSTKLDDKAHEVILTVTVTATLNEQTAFLVEVQQAGIFSIQGFEAADLEHMLNSFCPNILFPYAREFISSLVTRGGFPALYLTPVNFDALYQQHLTKKAASETNATESVQ